MPEEPNNTNLEPITGSTDGAADQSPTPEDSTPKVEATPAQSVAESASAPEQTVVTSAPQKSKKKMIIGIIAAALVVVLGGSAYATYSWYQEPQKVINDSFASAITAKSAILTGNMSVEADGNKVSMEISSKAGEVKGSFDAKLTVNADGKEYSINGSAIYGDSGDTYFKVSNLEGVVTFAKNSAGVTSDSELSTAIDKIVAKIDNKWIKITSEDLKEYSSDASESNDCLNQAIKKYKNDNAAINEIVDAYRKNPIITYDKNKTITQKDGSFGYTLKGAEKSTIEAFAKDIENTKIYKTLHDCDDSFKFDTSSIDSEVDSDSSDSEGTGSIVLWVDQWSHQITKIEANGESSGSKIAATLNTKFNQKVDITIPSSSISLAELKTYIEDLMTQYYSTTYSNYDDYSNYYSDSYDY